MLPGRVVWQLFADVSEERASLIRRVKQYAEQESSKQMLTWLTFRFEDEGSTLFRNVSKFLAGYML
jgi:hypothetical protein